MVQCKNHKSQSEKVSCIKVGLSGISGVMPREGIIGTYAPSLLTGKREKSYHKRRGK